MKPTLFISGELKIVHCLQFKAVTIYLKSTIISKVAGLNFEPNYDSETNFVLLILRLVPGFREERVDVTRWRVRRRAVGCFSQLHDGVEVI
jgi:hypothetical protein